MLKTRRLPLWPLLFVVGATLLLGSVSLIFPHGRDQGIHAYIADAMLAGKVVYRDVFNVKPPLTTVMHATALVLFGRSMTAIRLLDLLWTLATAVMLFIFARRAFKHDWLAAVAGAFYPLLYHPLGFWYTAQTDGWLNLPLIAALFLALSASEHVAPPAGFRRWFFAGVLIAVAALFKYTAAALLPALILVLLISGRKNIRQALLSSLWLGLGSGLTVTACALLLLISGAMPAFMESQFGLVPAYAMVGKSSGLFARLVDMLVVAVRQHELRFTAVLAVLGIIGALVLFVRRREWRYGIALIAALLFTAFASTFSQGKFFVYHYLPFLPVVALFAGLLAFLVLAPVFRRMPLPARFAAGTAFAFGLIAVSGYPAFFGALGRVAFGQLPLRDYWTGSRHNMGSDYSLEDNILLADHLRETTAPTERVFIWGFEPGVNFLSRRRTVTRFIYCFPMVIDWQPRRFRDEMMREYAADPAEVFVVEHNDVTPWVSGQAKDSYTTLGEFPELLDLLQSNYTYEGRLGRFDVLRLTAQR